MELGWCRQHLNFCLLPKLSRARHQRLDHFLHLFRETAIGVEVSTTDGAEDLVDGSIRRQCAVQDGELAFESAWYVVSSSAGLNHGSHKLNVDNVGEISRFVKTVESFHFHYLSDNFVRDLTYGKGH